MKQTESGQRKLSLYSLRQIFSFTSKDEDERQPLVNGGEGTVPVDTCYLTYIILYLHGVGHLLPWNFFITAHEVSKSSHYCFCVDTTLTLIQHTLMI